MSLLGSLLVDNQLYYELNIKSSDFYKVSHQEIFIAISGLLQNNKVAEPTTVAEHLKDIFDSIGYEYLQHCIDEGIITATILHWQEIIKDNSMLRQQINIAQDIISMAYSGDNANELVRQLDNIDDYDDDELVHINTVVNDTIEYMEEYKEGHGTEGIPCGIKGVDDYLNGLKKTELIYIAGRPGSGKSAFALDIAQGASARGAKVAVFNLEMSKNEMVKRLLVNQSRVHLNLLKDRKAEDGEWKRIYDAGAKLYKQNIFLSDKAVQTVSSIFKKCKRQKRKHGLDLIIIDYLQLFKADGKFNSTNDRVSHDSRMLKIMAKELDVPVICLSQLNRAVEQRDNKRPKMSDLRDSGSLEQDANSLIFLYREDYYHRDDEDYTPNHEVEIDIAKNRNGESGAFKMRWSGGTQRFDDL
jgi:replicative DNA helicase